MVLVCVISAKHWSHFAPLRSRSVQLEGPVTFPGWSLSQFCLKKNIPKRLPNASTSSRIVTVTISQRNSTLNFYTPLKKTQEPQGVCSPKKNEEEIDIFPYKANKKTGGGGPAFSLRGCRWRKFQKCPLLTDPNQTKPCFSCLNFLYVPNRGMVDLWTNGFICSFVWTRCVSWLFRSTKNWKDRLGAHFV